MFSSDHSKRLSAYFASNPSSNIMMPRLLPRRICLGWIPSFERDPLLIGWSLCISWHLTSFFFSKKGKSLPSWFSGSLGDEFFGITRLLPLGVLPTQSVGERLGSYMEVNLSISLLIPIPIFSLRGNDQKSPATSVGGNIFGFWSKLFHKYLPW